MNKKAAFFTALGLLLLAAALFLSGYNLFTARQAGESADQAVQEIRQVIEERIADLPEASDSEQYVPDYMLNPEMDMPKAEIDGIDYIGVLSIPSLGLELPVASDWSYPTLRKSPCRYTGSAYLNDLVIAAHNYARHFGNLKTLSPGDTVTFTDLAGNVFSYAVVSVELLEPTAVEEMTSGGFDLTLFTCTIGGKSRVTVRCNLV